MLCNPVAFIPSETKLMFLKDSSSASSTNCLFLTLVQKYQRKAISKGMIYSGFHHQSASVIEKKDYSRSKRLLCCTYITSSIKKQGELSAGTELTFLFVFSPES